MSRVKEDLEDWERDLEWVCDQVTREGDTKEILVVVNPRRKGGKGGALGKQVRIDRVPSREAGDWTIGEDQIVRLTREDTRLVGIVMDDSAQVRIAIERRHEAGEERETYGWKAPSRRAAIMLVGVFLRFVQGIDPFEEMGERREELLEGDLLADEMEEMEWSREQKP